MNCQLRPLFLLLLTSYQITFAEPVQSNSKFRQPKKDEVIRQIQSANEKYIPRIMNIATWNIQKTQNESSLTNLIELTKHHQMIFIQEMTDYKKNLSLLTKNNQLNINYAASFYLNHLNETTGVMNISTAQPIWTQFRRSPGRETFVQTPKITLIEEYMFSDNDRLLVLNIHGLNFVEDRTFKDQINDLTPLLKFYKFRILFAGDFNTWNKNRLQWLRQRLAEYNINQVEIENDTRKIQLDHFFMRGCQIDHAKIFNDIQSSDHRPLSLRLNCH